MELYGCDIEVLRNYFVAQMVDGADYHRIATEHANSSIIKRRDALLKTKHYTFRIGLGFNDSAKLVSFVNRQIYIATFNGIDYDNIILNACISRIVYWRSPDKITAELYKLSKLIIGNQNAGIKNDPNVNIYKYMNTVYIPIDVQKVFGLNKIYKSLKQTLINLRWFNIEDYEMPPITEGVDRHLYPEYKDEHLHLIELWDRYVVPEFIKGLEKYCFNDTLGVNELIFVKQKDIVLRFNISKKYKVNVLSASESTIADTIFGKLYTEAAGITMEEYNKGRTYRKYIDVRGCIPNNIFFKTSEMNKVFEDIKSKVIFNTKGDLTYTFKFNNVGYKIGAGGLHSVDKPAIFNANEDTHFLRDADVAAYYPSLVINNHIAPEHLNADIFINTTQGVVQDRKDAKPSGKNPDVTTDKTLKITINSGVFGKMGFEHGPIYDPKAMVSVTIPGQLYLLMLVEMLVEINCTIVSANTDGIICIIPIDKEKEYYRICDKWMLITGFVLEYTEYEKYIRRDVNNYIAVKTGDKPVMERAKFKGSLNPKLYLEDLRKGYNKPIVAQAIANHYLEGIPIRDTIDNCNDILDFCVSQKADKKFDIELRSIDKGILSIHNLTNNLRFYVSTNRSKLLCGKLMKNDTTIAEGTADKYTGIVAGRLVSMFNEYVELPIEEYAIDYPYYYEECMKIIRRIDTGKKTKKDIKLNYGQYKMGL